jgi:hypothetical protein
MQDERENQTLILEFTSALRGKEARVRSGLWKSAVQMYVGNPKGNIWAVFGSNFIHRQRRVVFMVYFAFLQDGPGSGVHTTVHTRKSFCSMFIDAWADARKPKTRLNTTLKILSSVFDVDFIECLNKADTHIRMDETHNLRQQIEKSTSKVDAAASAMRAAEERFAKMQAKYDAASKLHNQIALKNENILICKAIPCVNHLFKSLFSDYKGFNHDFVFQLINHITQSRAETAQQDLLCH